MSVRLLLVDNYDSFTYNLVQAFLVLGAEVEVHRNDEITVEQALAHPTWSMGPVVTINSASMMNKGLEVIEARWLFEVESNAIEVLVHPQSIVHSLVEYKDGSVLAQLRATESAVHLLSLLIQVTVT